MKTSLQPGKSFGSAATSSATMQRKGGLKTITDNRPSAIAQRKMQGVVLNSQAHANQKVAQRVKHKNFFADGEDIIDTYYNIYKLIKDYIYGYSLTEGVEAERASSGLARLQAQLDKSFEEKDRVQHGMQIFKGFLAQAIITLDYYDKMKLHGAEEHQSAITPLVGTDAQFVSADVVVKSNKIKKGTLHQTSGEKIVEVKYRPSSFNPEYEDKTLAELSAQIDKDYKVTRRVKVYWYGPMPKKTKAWAENLERTKFGVTFSTFSIGGGWDNQVT